MGRALLKRKFNIGELVYVPSDVTLFNASETHRLEKPTSLLIIGKENSQYEVLFKGQSWYIGRENIYELR